MFTIQFISLDGQMSTATSLNGLICLHSVLDKADSQSVFKRT